MAAGPMEEHSVTSIIMPAGAKSAAAFVVAAAFCLAPDGARAQLNPEELLTGANSVFLVSPTASFEGGQRSVMFHVSEGRGFDRTYLYRLPGPDDRERKEHEGEKHGEHEGASDAPKPGSDH